MNWSCFTINPWPVLSLDHMHIEEYIEEDEEPPLLLSSCPSRGKYAHALWALLYNKKRASTRMHTSSDSQVCFCVFQLFGCGGTAAVQSRWGKGCACLQCPAGQEPSKVRQQMQNFFLQLLCCFLYIVKAFTSLTAINMLVSVGNICL